MLDEHLDRRLKRFFGEEHEVVTVLEQGWGGKGNGELIETSCDARVDVLEEDVAVVRDVAELVRVGFALVTLAVDDGHGARVQGGGFFAEAAAYEEPTHPGAAALGWWGRNVHVWCWWGRLIGHV